MRILELAGIHKTYGAGAARILVLRDVSLAIRRGELCAITGASGSGKSTLLKLIGLLADEPTGNLDSDPARQVIDLFSALNRETGVTVIVVTHDALIAARCPRRIVVRDGRLVDDGLAGAPWGAS